MKRMMVLMLALCMVMTAACAMAQETFKTDKNVMVQVESITPEFKSVGEGAGYGAHAANQAANQGIREEDKAEYNSYFSSGSPKYFALTLPVDADNGTYKVYIPNSYFPGIQNYDVRNKVYATYAQRGDNNLWTGTVIDRKNQNVFGNYVESDTEWGLWVTVPMTREKPTVVCINYKSASGGNAGVVAPEGGNAGVVAPVGGAAANMPKTGDASMLGTWIALLGASSVVLKLRKKN